MIYFSPWWFADPGREGDTDVGESVGVRVLVRALPPALSAEGVAYARGATADDRQIARDPAFGSQ